MTSLADGNDPQSYAVSRIGPYAGILGPYAVMA
jgi:hypothetical protein